MFLKWFFIEVYFFEFHSLFNMISENAFPVSLFFTFISFPTNISPPRTLPDILKNYLKIGFEIQTSRELPLIDCDSRWPEVSEQSL